VSGKYWPAQTDETENRPSFISQPLPPENVITLPKSRPLHQILVENLNSTRALLTRLESGVCVPCPEQRELVRLLYVASRNQAKALIATLELQGLE
jgi:hypothetical protein